MSNDSGKKNNVEGQEGEPKPGQNGVIKKSQDYIRLHFVIFLVHFGSKFCYKSLYNI